MGKVGDYRKYRIRRGLHGLGLVSVSGFKRGERVIEYVGELIDDEEADRRSNRYLFIVRKDLNIDGSSRKNLARYVNHACRPNCTDDVVGKRIFYKAKRDIAPGEELTLDYGQKYFEHYIAPYGCRCGAEKHRRTKARRRKR